MKLELARKLRKERNFVAAEAELRDALRVYPGHSILREALAQLLLAGGKVSEAARLIEELQRDFPEGAGGFKLKGEVLLRQRRPREALEQFLEAERQQPSTYLTSLIVKALNRAGEHGEAIRRAEAALEAEPDNVWLLAGLETACAARGDTERATRVCEQLLKLRPQDPFTIRDLIRNRLAELSAGEALEELHALLRVPSYQRNPQLHILAGEQFYKQGDHAGAAAAFETALALEPSNRYALRQRGFCLNKLGNSEEAIGVLEPFFMEDPLDRFVRSVVVSCYKKLGRFEELNRLFERALAEHPELPQLHGLRKKALKGVERKG